MSTGGIEGKDGVLKCLLEKVMIMESILALLLTVILFLGQYRNCSSIFWAIWTVHYVNRAWAWLNRANINQN